MNTGLTIGINTFNMVEQNRRKNAGQKDELNDMEVSYTYIMSDRYYLPSDKCQAIHYAESIKAMRDSDIDGAALMNPSQV